MGRATTILVVGLFIANVFAVAWRPTLHGWHALWFPVLSVFIVWRSIRGDQRIAALRGPVAHIKGAGPGLRINLVHSARRSDAMSLSGFAGALALLVGVGAGIALYVLLFVRLARPLHLDFEAAWWIGAGGLSLLIALLAMTPLMEDRRTWVPVHVYIALVGVVSLGYGLIKQHEIRQAEARCAQAVAGVAAVQERLRIRATTPSCHER